MSNCNTCGAEYTFPTLHLKCPKQKDIVNNLFQQILGLSVTNHFELMKRIAEHMYEQKTELENFKFK